MNQAEQILVIYLSIFLSIFLTLAVIATVYIIRLTKKLNVIADNAQHVTESISSAADAFKKAAGPLAYGRGFASILNGLRRSKRDSDEER